MRDLERHERRELMKRLSFNELEEVSRMAEAGINSTSEEEAEKRYWEVVEYIRHHAEGRG